jgi:pyruvate,water dikinase
VNGFTDVLDSGSDPDTWWSRTLAAEAMPGVLTPLGWSVFGWSGEMSMRHGYAALGILPRAEVRMPDRSQDRIISVFAGRAGARVDFFLQMGDRIPVTSGAKVAQQILGFVPDGFTGRRDWRHLPKLATSMPRAFRSAPALTARAKAETDRWYPGAISGVESLDLSAARRRFDDAVHRFADCMAIQGIAFLCGVQPIYDQLTALIAHAPDIPHAELIGSYGSHEELRVVADLWELSRDRMNLATFLDRHGYHGPREGEIAATVWRDDPEPLRAVVAAYRALPEERNPVAAERRKDAQRAEAERALVAALPRARRPLARWVVDRAHTYLPLRGVAKVSFLQSLAVARSAARRIGGLLADAGVVDQPDDVFMLTREEVLAAADTTTRELVKFRRERFEHYQTLDLPMSWQGRPSPVPAPSATGGASQGVRGIGVSPGVVEGPVLVVLDPADTDMDPGEVLVARTTDPSWASVMFLASALVVDIGGPLSHAAVVAREMGVPCVMGTGDGTLRLRTGDRVRVDGGSGTVEVVGDR